LERDVGFDVDTDTFFFAGVLVRGERDFDGRRHTMPFSARRLVHALETPSAMKSIISCAENVFERALLHAKQQSTMFSIS